MDSKSLQTAMRMLARKSYHSLEMTKKLKEKGIDFEEIQEIVKKLKQDGYLDDEAWEESFLAGFLRKGRGSAVLGQYLHAKGLLSLLPKLKARVQAGEEEGLQIEIKKFKGDLKDPKVKQKLFLRLQRRGFNIEQIIAVL